MSQQMNSIMTTSQNQTPIQWPSPAKLNLFLYITGRRDNGYHDLQTLFQFIDYGDTLEFIPNDSGQITISPAIEGVELEQNLIWKAAQALRIEAEKEYNITPTSLGVDISLNKILPMGGGLGGGSSNAATALVALNELWCLNFSTDTLAELGLKLGADVPVFVRGHAAFAEGVGEKLVKAEPKEKWYLVIKPTVDIATAAIFTHPDLTRNTPKRSLSSLLEQRYENDCEKIVTLLYPEVAQLLSWLLQYAPSRLTGTGSCLFAEFETQQQAQTVLDKLHIQQDSNSVFGFIAQGVNTSPLYKTLADYKRANNN